MSKVRLIFGISGEKDAEHSLEVDAEMRVGDVCARALAEAGVGADKHLEFKIFLREGGDAVDSGKCIRDMAGDKKDIAVHISRCPRVEVKVHYQQEGQIVKASPGMTVAQVRSEVLSKFPNIGEKDKGHLMLFTKDAMLKSNRAIGQYVSNPDCTLVVDLRPDEGFAG